MRYSAPTVATLISILFVSASLGQVPDSLSFQGYLTDDLGNPLNSSGVDIVFNLYKGGSSVWTESQSVDVNNGVFNVYLGAAEPLGTVAFNRPMELGIKLDGEPSEITPRTPLAASAFALGIRGLYVVEATNGASSAPNLIGGAENNIVADGIVGATIGGGGGIFNNGARPNSALANWATVGGGQLNTASGISATVGGGEFNTASVFAATIAGGLLNTASNMASTVGGGFSNTASETYATVSGGREGTASGTYSTVGGGFENTASESHANVGGGFNNTASGIGATVAGGLRNTASGVGSFAAGQNARALHDGAFVWADSSFTSASDFFSSTASNQFLVRSTGGIGINTSTPDRELTVFDRDNSGDAVINIKASNSSARELLVGVNQSTGGIISMETANALDFRTDGNSRLHIEATGEVGIERTNATHPLHVGTNSSTGNGAHVTAAGVWTNGSSRTFKHNFREIDKQEVLDKVAELSVTRWNYRGNEQDDHIGPVAEDFAEQFGLGSDNRYIGTVDVDGVALAAIQGLYELVKKLQVENQQMRLAMRKAGID